MEAIQQPLMEQGILGIIALLSILGVIQVFRVTQSEKKTLLAIIESKDKTYIDTVHQFTKASIMTAEALSKLTTFLKAQEALNNSHGTINQ